MTQDVNSKNGPILQLHKKIKIASLLSYVLVLGVESGNKHLPF